MTYIVKNFVAFPNDCTKEKPNPLTTIKKYNNSFPNKLTIKINTVISYKNINLIVGYT